MALRDRFDKLVSYFDTDDVSEVEETVEEPTPQPTATQQSQTQSARQQQAMVQRQERAYQRQQTGRRQSVTERYQERPVTGQQRHDQTVRPASAAQPLYSATQQSAQLSISLKYPKQYDDAQAIVDLLNSNECVLIDFQYMLDAQARRCLDFIDGASKVLGGSLQKVGSSIYLLAPAIVSVNLEEAMHTVSQEANFDFDMKRR